MGKMMMNIKQKDHEVDMMKVIEEQLEALWQLLPNQEVLQSFSRAEVTLLLELRCQDESW